MVMSCPTGAADQAEEGPIEASDCCGVGWRQVQSFQLEPIWADSVLRTPL